LFFVFFVFWGLGVVGFCGLALVVSVYLGVPYAFFNKVFLLIKKKKAHIFGNHGEITLYPLDVFTYWRFDAQCLKIGR
jgi:hypothetical protein